MVLTQGNFTYIFYTINVTETVWWPSVLRSVKLSVTTQSRNMVTGKVEFESHFVFENDMLSVNFSNRFGTKVFRGTGGPETM